MWNRRWTNSCSHDTRRNNSTLYIHLIRFNIFVAYDGVCSFLMVHLSVMCLILATGMKYAQKLGHLHIHTYTLSYGHLVIYWIFLGWYNQIFWTMSHDSAIASKVTYRSNRCSSATYHPNNNSSPQGRVATIQWFMTESFEGSICHNDGLTVGLTEVRQPRADRCGDSNWHNCYLSPCSRIFPEFQLARSGWNIAQTAGPGVMKINVRVLDNTLEPCVRSCLSTRSECMWELVYQLRPCSTETHRISQNRMCFFWRLSATYPTAGNCTCMQPFPTSSRN